MTATAFIHPTALVETNEIGTGTRIWAFSHVLAGSSIGTNCNIGDHCFVEAGAVIGNDVTIKNGNAIWEGVTLEDGTFVGPGVLFTNDRRPRSPRFAGARYRDRGWLVPTLVRRGASLGAGAVVLAGITVGEFALVAARALLTHDVEPYALVVGAPARRRGWVCRCGSSLELGPGEVRCRTCSTRFRVSADGVEPL